MIRRRRVMIEVPEKDLIDEFGWFRERMCEGAVRAYLLRHLGIVDTGLDS